MWCVLTPFFGVLQLKVRYDRAFDLEKRQHLFANNVLHPLKRDEAGIFGMGAVTDLGVDVKAAEEELEKKWSRKKEGLKGIDGVQDGLGREKEL